MISGLRKAHKISWLMIAVTGTVFLYFTISKLNFSQEKLTERTLHTIIDPSEIAENEWVKVSLKGDEIEVIVKKSLKVSSAIVSPIIESDWERQDAIGQLSNVGIYRFSVDRSNLESGRPIIGILIYDEIKKVELTKLNF